VRVRMPFSCAPLQENARVPRRASFYGSPQPVAEQRKLALGARRRKANRCQIRPNRRFICGMKGFGPACASRPYRLDRGQNLSVHRAYGLQRLLSRDQDPPWIICGRTGTVPRPIAPSLGTLRYFQTIADIDGCARPFSGREWPATAVCPMVGLWGLRKREQR